MPAGENGNECVISQCYKMHMNQSFARPPTEKFPSVADGNKRRGPQLTNMQRVKDFGTLSLKGDVSIKSLSSVLRKAKERGSRKNVRTRDDGGDQGNKMF
ncbi:hypothetical protein STEG23_009731 [Scotinomys teguina]